jgi:uncharacterized protein (TIGR02284 family)
MDSATPTHNAPAISNKEVEETLRSVIQTLIDGQEGFQKLGEHVKEKGTVGGAIHRSWGDLKAHLGGSDHTLLETAEGGEDTAKKAYKDALENVLPLPVKQVLDTQYAHISASHDYVKAARDSRK